MRTAAVQPMCMVYCLWYRKTAAHRLQHIRDLVCKMWFNLKSKNGNIYTSISVYMYTSIYISVM